jgi:hypothetical protein
MDLRLMLPTGRRYARPVCLAHVLSNVFLSRDQLGKRKLDFGFTARGRGDVGSLD